jgi:hypothetical protein
VARAVVAWRQGHEINTFARSAALAYAWMGDAAGSYRAFNLLANNPRDAATADWARDWLDRLGKAVQRADLLAGMRAEVRAGLRLDAPMPPAFREWTVAHVDALRVVTRAVGLGKARTYIENMTMGNPTEPGALPLERPSLVAP